jgi:hypothetical protein
MFSTKKHLLNGVSMWRKGGTGEAVKPAGHGSWSNSRDIDTANRQGPQKRVTGPTSYANFTISKGKGKR